ncbi:ATP-binding protein [Candidatus Bipolaricaulota bacterium]|nr:ATP-binding protein [Candidatus Bipolaricaulota bacterium]
MSTPLAISDDLDLNLEQIIGQCIGILGIRGSGKSNTAGVIFEELLRNNYPLSIVDIDGEYFGLKERYEVLVVGHGEGVEIEIDTDCAEEIAQISMEKNIPIVLDLSGFLSDERTAFLSEYLTALWTLAGKLRRPYIIGIEEAHEFIPQGVKTELKELIARVALRGRKRGLGAIIISQRSAKVDKDVLSQAGMLFLHRVVHEVDMRVYSELLPWRKSETKEIITSLGIGDCVYINGDKILPIYVRERQTFHAGFTPSLEVVVTPELKQVSQAIIEAIEQAKTGKGKKSRLEELQDQLRRMENTLVEKETTISNLEAIARTLGYIKVEVPAPSLPEVQNISKAIVQSVEGKGLAHLGAQVGERAHPVSAGSFAPPVPVSERPFSTKTAVIEIEGSVEAPDDLPGAVRRHIDRVISRIAKQGIPHQRLLSFVIGHAPISYSVNQIAAWIGCAQGVIESDPPREFLDMGLLVRERRSDGLHYRSNLKGFVTQEFGVYQPDIGGGELHQITQCLRMRLGEE